MGYFAAKRTLKKKKIQLEKLNFKIPGKEKKNILPTAYKSRNLGQKTKSKVCERLALEKIHFFLVFYDFYLLILLRKKNSVYEVGILAVPYTFGAKLNSYLSFHFKVFKNRLRKT